MRVEGGWVWGRGCVVASLPATSSNMARTVLSPLRRLTSSIREEGREEVRERGKDGRDVSARNWYGGGYLREWYDPRHTQMPSLPPSLPGVLLGAQSLATTVSHRKIPKAATRSTSFSSSSLPISSAGVLEEEEEEDGWEEGEEEERWTCFQTVVRRRRTDWT